METMMKSDNKTLVGILAGGLLAILCCALPALLPVMAGAAFFAGPIAPWLVGAAAALVVLLLVYKVRRARTRQADCVCGATCASTDRGET